MTKTGVVAAALAASTLLAPSGLNAVAHADGGRGHGKPGVQFEAHLGHGAYLSVDHGLYHSGKHHRTHGKRRYYYDDRAHRKFLRRACRAAIRQEADFIGFREVDFDSRGRIDQIGPRRFRVFFGEVEFEGRRREFERSVVCEVARGRVQFVDGVPRPGKRRSGGHFHY